jgi:hypothetical protein
VTQFIRTGTDQVSSERYAPRDPDQDQDVNILALSSGSALLTMRPYRAMSRNGPLQVGQAGNDVDENGSCSHLIDTALPSASST